MSSSNLFRLTIAALATTTLLTAQSAPTARVRRAAPPAEASPDKVQVRLAEVIAMLEEDDLTPQQREAAKKKLQEIVARLRTPAPNPPSPPDLVEPAPPPSKAPKAPRAARAPTAPQPKPKVSLEAVEEPPAPKATRGLRVIAAEEADKLHDRGVVVIEGHDGEKKTVRVLRPDGGARGEWRVMFDEGKAKALAKASGQWRELTEEAMAKAKAFAESAGEWREFAEDTKRHHDKVELEWRQKADESKAKIAERAAVRVRERSKAAAAAEHDAAQRAGRRAVVRVRGAESVNDDDEIREMIEAMRAEMREIRALMQKMRAHIDDRDAADDDAGHDRGTAPAPFSGTIYRTGAVAPEAARSEGGPASRYSIGIGNGAAGAPGGDKLAPGALQFKVRNERQLPR